jgi:tetraprenyl-beta-curcumene synthase
MNSPALALLLANGRYWPTVAVPVGRQLTRWELAADAIGDPQVRALALAKLRDEHFNVQVAATLATLAPRRQRPDVIEAIVALQVMYDYLDLLTESMADPRDGRRLFAALIDPVSVGPAGTRKSFELPQYNCDRYLERLSRAVALAIARLPGAATVVAVARGAAERCSEAQILHHGASRSGIYSGARSGSYWGSLSEPCSGIADLRCWATRGAAGTGLGWAEYLAGSTASVLSMHALIAAAADPRMTSEDAVALDRAYLSIGALTMLDSLVDREEDIASGQLSYLQLYDGPEAMAEGLAKVARDGVTRARGLPHGAHHAMTLVGVVGYYASDPAANDDVFARPVIARVKRELRPLITPTLALMRAWRLAKRVRSRRDRPQVRQEILHA